MNDNEQQFYTLLNTGNFEIQQKTDIECKHRNALLFRQVNSCDRLFQNTKLHS